MLDTQESSSSTKARASPPFVSGIQESSSSTAVPLLKDPSAWRLMMDWAQDKIGFSELDDRMRAYGPRYIPEEWKVLIDEVFMLSDPGVESTSSPSLVIERAMESQGISLLAAPPAPSFWASTRSTSSSQSATCRCCKSCRVTQNKRRKLNSSVFLDIDTEDKGKEDEGEEEEEDEEGRRNYGPQQEGTSILVYKARQVLPTRNWVRIKQSAYKGNIGYVEESTESEAVVLVAPRQLPYDLPEESGERMRFDVELARLADLDFVPILSPSGAEIRYSCSGQQFVHGLLRLTLPVNTLEGKRGVLADVDLHKRSAVVLCDGDAFGCNLRELHRVFKIGDTVEVIAGPFCREMGYVVALHEHTLVLIVMQPDKTSDNIEVSKFVVQSQLPEHILSLGPEDNEPQLVHPLPGDKALPGDLVHAHCGPYTGQTGIIEWIGSDSKVWDKGYNVAVGHTVEVVRGQWRDSQGIVKAVDLTKASLDIVRPTDRVQINVPITFSHKIMERFEHGLLKFIGRDVWVIAGDKKGSRATLRTIGRISGMLLDSTLLPPQLQHALKALHSRSFITPVVPHSVTLPPSPGPSNVGLSDAWTITPANITQTQTPDYGDVPWLFEPDFCDFKSFHLGFNVSVGFTQVSLGKHNAGSAIQHLTIPARYLKPANPTGKNQLCLILKGPQAGQVVHIKKCQRASKSVVTEDVFRLNSFDGLTFYQDNYIFLLWNLLWLAPIDDGLEGFMQLSLPFVIVRWQYTNHFAGVLVTPLRCQGDNMAAREGCPIPCDLARTVQSSQGQDLALGSPPNISCMASLVEVTQKCKFCEDQDSALGPPLKISRGTSLTIQTSAVNIQPISPVPPVIVSLKRKARSSCFIWWLPNELLVHITTLLPQNSLLALTQACQLLREITAPLFFVLLGFDTPQSNYLSLDDNGCEGLLVWWRTEAFVVPNSLCFSISQMTTDYHLWQGGPSSAPTSVLRAQQTDPFILAPAGKHPRVRMQGIDLLRLGMGKRATGLL
ncbi:hypothetical protein EDD17DRAFT_1510324 [Pisolithus thermaeus]|nr:hypothetical protein EDD17DRAFT_1510324 [Pisolithus thermaeus]